MGARTRENTRNFFSLDFLTGNNARREANRQQAAATELFQRALYGSELAGYDDIFQFERTLRSPDSELSRGALGHNQEYQQGQAAQLQALRQMQGIAQAGGYTNLERDQIAQAQRQAAGYEKSQRDAQLQQMQMRGMAGGGGEMAARLQAQQGGANRAAGQATDIATQAQMRALQAMQAGGQMGQQQQTQATNRASALDAFNQANTNRGQSVNQRNAAGRTAAINQAQQNRTDQVALLGGQYNANAGRSDQQAANAQGLLTGIIGAVA